MMQVGIAASQGYMGEYEGWEPGRAFEDMVTRARTCDELGFDSVWVYDHFLPRNSPAQRFMLESFVSAAAIARETRRIGVGHLVVCASFRNPGLTAKMASALDAASGGRYQLGLGAGWKEDEWRSFGYGFPPVRQRLAALEESAAIIVDLLETGASTRSGELTATNQATNEPRGVQRPRIPVMIGGNGRKVTWSLAARYADELNLDAISPVELGKAMPVIRSRCVEVGRDPDSLKVSVHVWGSKPNLGSPDRLEFLKQFQTLPTSTLARIDLLRRYEALGVSRLQIRFDDEDGSLSGFAEECVRAGVNMA